MSKFDKHFRMNEQDAVEYIREKLPDFFAEEDTMTCKEIGDGNINYVFRVSNGREKSVIVKHADIMVRSSGRKASTDRNRIEAQILQKQRYYSPKHVPEVYLYDPVMCCVVMQDVSDHVNMRYAMMEHKTFSTFAKDIGEFMAETMVPTTDFIMASVDKKRAVGDYINPDMCRISERLVFTEPYTNADGSNKPFYVNESFLEKELYQDQELRREVAKLKMHYECCAQALIHGDLHSGSIFLKEGSTMVLDPEFAFYGPMGYDIGNVIAHLIFAWSAAKVSMEEGGEKERYLHWVEKSIVGLLDTFREKAKALCETTKDPMYANDGYQKDYLDGVDADTAGYCGTEVIRRVIGSAKVKDITALTPDATRAQAEKICVIAAKELIKNRGEYIDHSRYVAVLKAAAQRC